MILKAAVSTAPAFSERPAKRAGLGGILVIWPSCTPKFRTAEIRRKKLLKVRRLRRLSSLPRMARSAAWRSVRGHGRAWCGNSSIRAVIFSRPRSSRHCKSLAHRAAAAAGAVVGTFSVALFRSSNLSLVARIPNHASASAPVANSR